MIHHIGSDGSFTIACGGFDPANLNWEAPQSVSLFADSFEINDSASLHEVSPALGTNVDLQRLNKRGHTITIDALVPSTGSVYAPVGMIVMVEWRESVFYPVKQASGIVSSNQSKLPDGKQTKHIEIKGPADGVGV